MLFKEAKDEHVKAQKAEKEVAAQHKQRDAQKKRASGAIDMLKDVIISFEGAVRACEGALAAYMHQTCELLLAKAKEMMSQANAQLVSSTALPFTTNEVKAVASEMIAKTRTS